MLAACGGGGGGLDQLAPDPTGGSAPATTGAGAGKKPSTAADVLAALKAKIPTITQTFVYDASSDPNTLLGRPGQYTSKAGFHDSRVPAADVEFESQPFAVRRGGDIEVFPEDGLAKARGDYIGGIVNQPSSGILGGPEYIYRVGKVLLRVSRSLTPAQAAEYERFLKEAVG